VLEKTLWLEAKTTKPAKTWLLSLSRQADRLAKPQPKPAYPCARFTTPLRPDYHTNPDRNLLPATLPKEIRDKISTHMFGPEVLVAGNWPDET
jgi:hypothetical protein